MKEDSRSGLCIGRNPNDKPTIQNTVSPEGAPAVGDNALGGENPMKAITGGKTPSLHPAGASAKNTAFAKRRGFVAGLGASLATGLIAGALPQTASAKEVALFRIACGPPATGLWRTATTLAKRLYSAQSTLPDALAPETTTGFRATAFAESHTARTALLTGAVESALLVSYPGATLPDQGFVLGTAGDAVLHFLVRPEVQMDATHPLTGLRIALNSERLLIDSESLAALGAEQILSLSISDGFDALYGNGVDGLFFWDLPPNPFAHTALSTGRARQVALWLKDEPTTTQGANLYNDGFFAPRTTRPAQWILSDGTSPWRTSLEQQADSLLRDLNPDSA